MDVAMADTLQNQDGRPIETPSIEGVSTYSALDVVSREAPRGEDTCSCGRGPKRAGGAGNCLHCHREIQKRYRDRRRAELAELRQIARVVADDRGR